MSGRARGHWPSAVLVSLLAAGVLSGCSPSDEDVAVKAAAAFASAWSAGKYPDAGKLTSDPAAAGAALKSQHDQLAVATLTAKAGVATCQTAKCVVVIRVAASLRTLGEVRYETSVPVVVKDGKGTLSWAPGDLHPKFTAGATWQVSRQLPPRASILDRNGAPLTQNLPVITVGVQPNRFTNPTAGYALLAKNGVDAAALAARVKAAKPDAFVDAITLRESDFSPQRAAFDAVPGLVYQRGTRSLAPDRNFARALLGSTGPATAEALKNAGPLAAASDEVGLSGLQQQFQRQLAGRPGGEVQIVPKGGGQPITIASVKPVPGTALATTLDPAAQHAADSALASAPKNASMVVLQASTGQVLAVANGPQPTAENRAFTGRYPPGSTFKVVTTTALLGKGLDVNAPVPCPPSITIGGKKFVNAEGEQLTDPPFSLDFAKSCNTAFVSLVNRLSGDDLARAAHSLGIANSWALGVPAFSGQVPAPKDVTDQAASMIGQSTVLVSPLALAVAAASVASGATRTPTLLPQSSGAPAGAGASTSSSPANQPTPTTSAAPLPAGTVQTLHRLMRSVVTDGTGTALKSATPPVSGKTGTAEFGNANPPQTHAWFIGFAGDVAFAVVVEGGGFGGDVAAPLAGKFLAAYPH